AEHRPRGSSGWTSRVAELSRGWHSCRPIRSESSGFPRSASRPTGRLTSTPIRATCASSSSSKGCADRRTMAIEAPRDLMFVGRELAIVWPDGREDYIPLEPLRRNCPCAMCKGEKDIFGNVYKGAERPYTPASFQPVAHRRIGAYALQID